MQLTLYLMSKVSVRISKWNKYRYSVADASIIRSKEILYLV